MARVGVTVGELEHVVRPALGHEGIVDVAFRNHRSHGNGAVSELLGHVHDVGDHTEGIGTGHCAATAETGNHLVEDQQDIVCTAQFPQPLQVAHRWRDHAGRTGHRFNDHGRDIAGIVQGNQLQ